MLMQTDSEKEEEERHFPQWNARMLNFTSTFISSHSLPGLVLRRLPESRLPAFWNCRVWIVETRLKSWPRTIRRLNWHYNNSLKVITFFCTLLLMIDMFKVWRWINCSHVQQQTEVKTWAAGQPGHPMLEFHLYSLKNRSVGFRSCSYSPDLLGRSAALVWRLITDICDIHTLTQQQSRKSAFIAPACWWELNSTIY